MAETANHHWPALETDTIRVFRAPAEFIDSDHLSLAACAGRIRGQTAAATAVAIFEFVRDLPYEGNDFEDLAIFRASHVLAAGHGYCVSKASLGAALARAAGIPARIAFADVRNHLASPRLLRLRDRHLRLARLRGDVARAAVGEGQSHIRRGNMQARRGRAP
jgi:transglutaminase-like putative cysteine protease